jgi:DNA replication protein DnaC
MLNKQTMEKLTRLKLPAMAESYRRLSENPEYSSLSPDELLGMIVDAEWTSRHNKRLNRLLKLSGMTHGPCIEDIDYRLDRKLDRQIIVTLSECGFITSHRNIIISGKTGTGKSFLACALGNMACRLDYTVKYFRLPRLLTDLSIAKMDGSYNRYLSQLKKCHLLILDDWGLAEITAADSRDILEVIEDRVNTGSMIIAAQIPPQDWYALFSDPTLADACLDRLVHNAYRIEVEGDSMRRIMANSAASPTAETKDL